MRIRLGIGSMRLAIAAGGLAIAVGCGGGRDAVDKHLSDLRAELVKVRAEHAVLADRLDSLERASASERGALRAPAGETDAAPAPEQDRPELEVVRLAPEGSDARPVLHSTPAGTVVHEAPSEAPPRRASSTPSRRTP